MVGVALLMVWISTEPQVVIKLKIMKTIIQCQVQVLSPEVGVWSFIHEENDMYKVIGYPKHFREASTPPCVQPLRLAACT